jgi:hypothetical protein
MATFDSATGLLAIPALEVNLSGSVSVFTNVVFKLIDATSARFLLDTYDQ